jgi:hypothetical protein
MYSYQRGRMRLDWLVVIVLLLAPTSVFAKGEGVGVYLEGLVSDVRAEGRSISFRLSGSLDLTQFRRGEQSVIRIQGRTPVEVTTRQGDFCFVLIDDWSWHPGPCRAGQLREALERAAREHLGLRLELGRVALRFGGAENDVEVTDSETLRVKKVD